MNIRELLNDAKVEIRSLRRRNEILSAKVEVFDSLMCLLHTQPSYRPEQATIDICAEMEKYIIENIE